MSSDIIRRSADLPVRRESDRALARIGGAVRVEQGVIRAKAVVGEFAVNEVTYLKAVQKEFETRNPDAAEAVALIINTTVASIARDVAQFGSELG